jgi:hypothetical protein
MDYHMQNKPRFTSRTIGPLTEPGEDSPVGFAGIPANFDGPLRAQAMAKAEAVFAARFQAIVSNENFIKVLSLTFRFFYPKVKANPVLLAKALVDVLGAKTPGAKTERFLPAVFVKAKIISPRIALAQKAKANLLPVLPDRPCVPQMIGPLPTDRLLIMQLSSPRACQQRVMEKCVTILLLNPL